MTTASREARCSRHPETAAVELCVRCGSFACIQCVVIRYEGIYCVDCARRVPFVAFFAYVWAGVPIL